MEKSFCLGFSAVPGVSIVGIFKHKKTGA